MHRGRHTLTQGRRELSICSALVASGVVCCGNGDLVTNPTPVVRSGGQPTRRCVRPWEVYTGVRRDGDTFPNVVGIRPHVCMCDLGAKTRVYAATGINYRTRLEFARTYVCDLGVVGIRPHVCVRPRGLRTSVRCDGTFFRTCLEFARTCVCDLGKYTRVCAATGINFRTWLEFARTCVRDLGAKHKCAPRRESISKRGWNSPTRVCATLENRRGCAPIRV